jgi:DNA-binding LytR/AlgR family response regulator
MPLRCLLIDDEPPAIKLLESYIAPLRHLEVAGTCANALEAGDWLRHHPADVLFLDISMPLLLGTEFLRTLRHPPKVIFTTAYAEYALEGFELEAVDYLLKPISLERFLKATNKLLAEERGPEPGVGMQAVRSAGMAAPESAAFLYFQVDRKMVKVLFDDILYIESLKDYVKIVRNGHKPLVAKQSIGALELLLPENLFLRIHRSFIIAIGQVTAFTRQDLNVGGKDIPVGRLYAHQLSRLGGK